MDLAITSSAFENNGSIPAKYTADGENISPPITITGVSERALSLVLIIDDPDAATDPNGPGIVYDHWLVFNIPPETVEIAENSVPPGATQGKNSGGESKYTGPAPPTGTHRYFFRLYALSHKLDLDENATKDEVQNAMKPVLISKTEMAGNYASA